jgi:protein-L-isoaspartate(D-aspartate) O-methyltransferase
LITQPQTGHSAPKKTVSQVLGIFATGKLFIGVDLLMTPDELKIVRRAYAKQITAVVRIVDERVEAAFAEVPREDFLGPGPWPIFRMRKAYVPTPTADPVYLYTDDIVGIVPDCHINNGQPSLHAFLLSQAAPRAIGRHPSRTGRPTRGHRIP